jgi:serine-type D-Ala-D-Ala carboxypeptidase (penicillin-binding protein 5/6)
MRFLTAVCLLFAASASFAQPLPVPSAPVIGATSYFMIDADSGAELASLNPDTPVPPASLTKIMTAYVVFEAIANGTISLDDEVTVSEKAWRMQGSRMFIEVGNQVRVEDLLLGVIVQSGNDASVALAEHVAGSEEVFADLMNRTAQRLGMRSSHFVNATGWPDDDHYSTARDLATLARAMIHDFPEHYAWHSIREFQWGDIKQQNRNTLLWRDESVDGLKTGHTDAAGYCLVASATRDGMRVISVVLGTASDKARSDGSQALINYGFRFYETHLLYKAGEEVTRARVWKSSKEFTPLGVLEDLYITVPRGTYDALESVQNLPATLMAPVADGQPVGEIVVSLDGQTVLQEPLRALDDNPSGSFWQRTVDGVKLWFE